MVTSRTAMMISLGIFLGVLSYGIQTTIINYNCVVNPGQPLQILSLEKGGRQLSFLGEKCLLPPGGIRELQAPVEDKIVKFKKVAGEFYQQVVGKYNYYREYFRGHL